MDGANPTILQCTMTEAKRTRKPSPPRAVPAPVYKKPVVVSAQAKEGLGWLHTAKFLTSASKISQLPAGDMPEIAFVGRSNAGKSSAINTLAQQRQLAFASKTPGRTQLINLFTLGPREAPDAYFADLPGYGYAAVARGKKLVWQKVMADYLEVRRALIGRGADGRQPPRLHAAGPAADGLHRAARQDRRDQAAGAAHQVRQAGPARPGPGRRGRAARCWPTTPPRPRTSR